MINLTGRLLQKSQPLSTLRALRSRANAVLAAADPAIWRQLPTEVTTLSNGLRIASQPTYDDTITVGVWIDAGSRFETRETNGAAHFLEHMAFKGTKRRSRIGLEQEIENMGGHLNAYTSREQTVYYAKVFKEDLEQGVDILADILNNSTLDQHNLEFERGVILREMEEVEKTTEEVIFDRLHLTAFRDSPLGFTILGPVENIQSITQQDLRDYIAKNYTTDRLVVAAAGPVDHKEFVRIASEKFSGFKPGGAKQDSLGPKPVFCGADLLYNDDEVQSAHVAVAFEGVPWKSPDAFTFMLMQAIIGSFKHGEGVVPGELSGNRITNRLCNSPLEGNVEMYSAFNTCYKDTGLFGFYAECDQAAVERCISELLFGITWLSQDIVDAEVERGKRQLKTTLFGNLDSTTAIAEDVGRQLLVYGRRLPMAELLLRLESIDAKEVRRVASKYLVGQELAVTGLGALQGMPSLGELRKMASMQRC